MAVNVQQIEQWCRVILGVTPKQPQPTLGEYLEAIPRLDSLNHLPSAATVLVRGDVDAKPGAQIGDGDIRLRSMMETLNFGRERGWTQVIFGHIGRKPEGSLQKVAARLGQLLESDVPLLKDWLDAGDVTIRSTAVEAIKAARPGSVMVLENTRAYPIERCLWKADEADIPKLAANLARLANQFADKISTVYINEAFSAGSLDASSTVVPAAMQRVCLGAYVAGEYSGPLLRCLAAKLVVFSGLKIDKLDDLEAMINRGTIRAVISAGSLAMALKKAAAQLDGGDFCMGVAEDPAHEGKPYFIPNDRVQQARRMIAQGREKGIEFILPVDFVLQDGKPADTVGVGDQQFDVGPKTNAHFAQKVGEFITASADAPEPAVAFHNGVFGMFEDSRFEEGTRLFVSQLKRMKDAGVQVYVGGGEGGKALDQYGQPDWVTHCFTAGGTVLNALGSDPVPYLVALQMKSRN